MIIRARPKYLNGLLRQGDYGDSYSRQGNSNYLFFSTGRAALKFLLQVLAVEKKKVITIAMQSFNCNVVMDAAIEAGCKVVLYDIKLEDFSISYIDLIKSNPNVDILLLTHYQGIPNFEYEKIVDYCNNNSILVIEDLAQTYGSRINLIEVGSLGSFAITSYAFDKPFCCSHGGALILNTVTENLMTKIFSEYSKLPTEKLKSAQLDINLLFFLFKHSTEKTYHIGINEYDFTRFLIFLNMPQKMIYYITFIFKLKLVRKLYHKSKYYIQKNKEFKIKILKLNELKINIIQWQLDNYKFTDQSRWVENLLQEINVKPINHTNEIDICWNRYSVLDKDNKLKNWLKKNNIEAGNYNWPVPLHIKYKNHSKVETMGRLDNSEFASLNVINIPIWHVNE